MENTDSLRNEGRTRSLGRLGRVIPASRKVLTENLRKLESLGLISRRDLGGRVRHVEYDLVEPVRLGTYLLLSVLRNGRPFTKTMMLIQNDARMVKLESWPQRSSSQTLVCVKGRRLARFFRSCWILSHPLVDPQFVMRAPATIARTIREQCASQMGPM